MTIHKMDYLEPDEDNAAAMMSLDKNGDDGQNGDFENGYDGKHIFELHFELH